MKNKLISIGLLCAVQVCAKNLEDWSLSDLVPENKNWTSREVIQEPDKVFFSFYITEKTVDENGFEEINSVAIFEDEEVSPELWKRNDKVFFDELVGKVGSKYFCILYPYIRFRLVKGYKEEIVSLDSSCILLYSSANLGGSIKPSESIKRVLKELAKKYIQQVAGGDATR